MRGVNHQIETLLPQKRFDFHNRKLLCRYADTFRFRQQRLAILVATQASTSHGCVLKNSTSSRPSVVPPNTQILYIPVSPRRDQPAGNDL